MLTPQERLTPAADRLKVLQNRQSPTALVIHEIYASLQGESSWAGIPCTFVRTSGCHLRCVYCDTAHAFNDGTSLQVEEILDIIKQKNNRLVEITGGEPLLQKAIHELIKKLCELDYEVLMETSGAVSIQGVDRRAHMILDIKTPGSGEEERNVWSNLPLLKPHHDEVKFVITDRDDYDYAKRFLMQQTQVLIPQGVMVLLSAAAPLLDPKELAEWIIHDTGKCSHAPYRFQLQMHKVLWGNLRGV